MPRVTRASAKAMPAGERKAYFKPPSPKAVSSGPKPARKSKDGEDSHLYKDAVSAQHTIQALSGRALVYQFQRINSIYNSAKHDPHSANDTAMQAAMKILRSWLDETYSELRENAFNFPLLGKDVVELYLPEIKERKDELGVDARWAELYVALPKGKRLADVLIEETAPEDADLAKVRQGVLEDVVMERSRKRTRKRYVWPVWDSAWHLKCIAYGFSPRDSKELIDMFERHGTVVGCKPLIM